MSQQMALSTSLTPIFRTVMPAGWALMLPVSLLVNVPEELAPSRWFFVAGLSVLLIQSAAWFIRLKDVHADGEGLVVSNGRFSARVPWTHVAAIRKPWWGKGQFARIELRAPTRFGSTVLLMLRISPFTRWRDHPSVRIVSERMAAPPRRGDA